MKTEPVIIIVDAFIINQVGWMEDATRKTALEKLDMMSSHIGYPDELLNDTEVNSYYQGIELAGGNFLECSLNVTLFTVLKKYSLLRTPVNEDEWSDYGNVAVVNGQYGNLLNVIGNYIWIDNIWVIPREIYPLNFFSCLIFFFFLC